MTKAEKFYDVALRLPVIACFLFFLALELRGMRGIVALQPYFGGDLQLLISLADRSAILVFLLACIGFHVSPYRPLSRRVGPYSKIVAFAGMLFSLLLLLMSRAPSAMYWDSLSVVLILVGTSVFVLAVFELGHSSNVMPEARTFPTTGLYGCIRHPLHLAEEIVVLGIFLQVRSLQGLLVLAVHFYLQTRRMRIEEGILDQLFPTYAEYKERTRRLVPGVY